jgi:hypothetical protein
MQVCRLRKSSTKAKAFSMLRGSQAMRDTKGGGEYPGGGHTPERSHQEEPCGRSWNAWSSLRAVAQGTPHTAVWVSRGRRSTIELSVAYADPTYNSITRSQVFRLKTEG